MTWSLVFDLSPDVWMLFPFSSPNHFNQPNSVILTCTPYVIFPLVFIISYILSQLNISSNAPIIPIKRYFALHFVTI